MAGALVSRPAEPGRVRCGHHQFWHLDSPMGLENLLCRQEQGRRLAVGATVVANMAEVVDPNRALACHQRLSASRTYAIARKTPLGRERVDERTVRTKAEGDVLADRHRRSLSRARKAKPPDFPETAGPQPAFSTKLPLPNFRAPLERPYMDAPCLPSFQFMMTWRFDCTRRASFWLVAWSRSRGERAGRGV